ncbi:hypothetical protein [Bacillus pseudomycoides]|uniref:hypothetical protein n=1 Tax=Bacillus pseudomycoides TaxID=64104 RepID=UPI000BFC28CD|nr:hypothetical protein [Bacillus pseudomycoides]PGE04285.1 hypothetical protein COM49_08850 [Bacillus pseudomycoides]PHG20746.1 hypothetical protein COI47_15970 [Bacillus pseudomycoides]
MIHPMTLVRCVGLAIWLYSLLGLSICAKRKRWEECIKFSGYGMVGLFLFFGKEIAEVAKYIGSPIAFGGGL